MPTDPRSPSTHKARGTSPSALGYFHGTLNPVLRSIRMTLDINILPPDIHSTILSNLMSSIGYRFQDGKEYVTNPETLRTLLGYAKLGPLPHYAVLELLKFTVSLWRCSDLSNDLISYFSMSLMEVDLSQISPVLFSDPIPKLPYLRKATVSATLYQLELIRHSPDLQHLRISLEFSSEWDFFVAIISTYQLKTLDLSYQSRYGEKLHDRDWNIMKLKTPCDNLCHLTLRGKITLTGSVRLLVSCLQSLKKLTLNVELYDYNIGDLKHIPHLEIMNGFCSSFFVIDQLKDRVKSIGGDVEDRGKILALASFSQLRHLKIGAPKNLGDSLRAVVTKLESLSIRFPFSLSLYRGRPYPGYHKLETAPFISSLEKAKKLSFLCLQNMLVSGNDVRKILEAIGKNLKEFHICIDWQREQAANRIEVILKSVAQFCPNLHVLTFLEDLSGIVPCIVASEDQKRKCLEALLMICNAAQRFSSYSKIVSVILNRFKVEREQNELTWDLVFPPYE